MIAGNYYKIRPNADNGWRTVTPLCPEYSSSRPYPKTKALSAIPEGTIIGPVSEVHVVKILDRYSINCKTNVQILRCDIQRNRAFCQWWCFCYLLFPHQTGWPPERLSTYFTTVCTIFFVRAELFQFSILVLEHDVLSIEQQC